MVRNASTVAGMSFIRLPEERLAWSVLAVVGSCMLVPAALMSVCTEPGQFVDAAMSVCVYYW